MTNYVLQAEDVAIHYGGVKAVDGVALTLEKGQIRGLIGPNGAGKSTVIDAITGRRKLTRGKVSLLGQDVSALGVVERRMRGLSRSFQRTSVFGQMTVYRQIELASHKMGVKDSAADAEAVLAARRRVLGDTHNDTIGTVCNLGGVQFGLITDRIAPSLQSFGLKLAA